MYIRQGFESGAVRWKGGLIHTRHCFPQLETPMMRLDLDRLCLLKVAFPGVFLFQSVRTLCQRVNVRSRATFHASKILPRVNISFSSPNSIAIPVPSHLSHLWNFTCNYHPTHFLPLAFDNCNYSYTPSLVYFGATVANFLLNLPVKINYNCMSLFWCYL